MVVCLGSINAADQSQDPSQTDSVFHKRHVCPSVSLKLKATLPQQTPSQQTPRESAEILHAHSPKRSASESTCSQTPPGWTDAQPREIDEWDESQQQAQQINSDDEQLPAWQATDEHHGPSKGKFQVQQPDGCIQGTPPTLEATEFNPNLTSDFTTGEPLAKRASLRVEGTQKKPLVDCVFIKNYDPLESPHFTDEEKKLLEGIFVPNAKSEIYVRSIFSKNEYSRIKEQVKQLSTRASLSPDSVIGAIFFGETTLEEVTNFNKTFFKLSSAQFHKVIRFAHKILCYQMFTPRTKLTLLSCFVQKLEYISEVHDEIDKRSMLFLDKLALRPYDVNTSQICGLLELPNDLLSLPCSDAVESILRLDE